MKETFDKRTDFQTPKDVCEYMCSLIPTSTKSVLEPTPGTGNIVKILSRLGYDITTPKCFFELNKNQKFDCIIMNPPFSSKYAFNVPKALDKHGMRLGYHILLQCMQMSENVIALMPWFTISDSDVRLRAFKIWGLKSITALPRKTFQYARIQTCVLELQKNYRGITSFKVFDLLNDVENIKMF